MRAREPYQCKHINTVQLAMQALVLFQQALDERDFKQQRWDVASSDISDSTVVLYCA